MVGIDNADRTDHLSEVCNTHIVVLRQFDCGVHEENVAALGPSGSCRHPRVHAVQTAAAKGRKQ